MLYVNMRVVVTLTTGFGVWVIMTALDAAFGVQLIFSKTSVKSLLSVLDKMRRSRYNKQRCRIRHAAVAESAYAHV